MARYARPAARYVPRGWGNLPLAFVDRQFFRVTSVPESMRAAFLGLDAQSDFDSFAYPPPQRAALDWMIRRGYAQECERGASLDAFARFRRADTPYLREIHWAVTGRCNLRCRHCFMEAPGGRYGEMDWPELTRMAEQMVRANVAMVSLTGGEPLLHPDIRRLIALLSESGIIVNEIVTNGTLLDEDFFAFLRAQGQKPMFQISYDGAGTHDEMRGVSGAETAALDAIRLCVQNGCFVAVTSIFSRENIGALLDTYETLKRLQPSTWLISRAQTAGLWQGGAAALSADEMGEALLALARRWFGDGQPLHMLLENYFEARPQGAPPARVRALYTPLSPECPETKERAFLLPDGTLLPCPGFTGTPLAARMPSLRESELADIWRESDFTRFCAESREARLQKNPECAACPDFAKCGMGCRAYALTEGGDLFGPDPGACRMYRGGWRERFERERETFFKEKADD